MMLARPVRLMILPTTVTPAADVRLHFVIIKPLGLQKGTTLALLTENVQDKALGACQACNPQRLPYCDAGI